MFTPSLGLFDSLHHGRLAALSVHNGQREFDRSKNGLRITFENAWEPYRIEDISKFNDIPVGIVVLILGIMLIYHILGSICILKLTMKNHTIKELVFQSCYSLITPPLHIDWEKFYRISDGGKPIGQCWKR